MTFEEFLLFATLDHLQTLATFASGARITVTTDAEAATFRQQAADLFGAGLLWRTSEGRELQSGTAVFTFDGYVTAVVAGFIGRALRERADLARVPAP
jgi:hypothetical protein